MIFGLLAWLLQWQGDETSPPVKEQPPEPTPKTVQAPPPEPEEVHEPSQPTLVWPVDCSLGSDCWIARYVDRGAGDTVADYACGVRSENAHKGTDITLSDVSVMRRGVNVLAAAPGRISGRRDGVADKALVTKEDRAAIKGRECGNGVVIQHEGGWETQYCHMAEGSLTRRQGETVEAGDVLGRVGLSGATEYPHLHFMLRDRREPSNPQIVDPFDGGVFEKGCGAAGAPLSHWREDIEYHPVALLPPRLVATELTRTTMWRSQPPELSASSPALLLQARSFHTRTGDVLRFTLVQPDGRVRLQSDRTIERGYQVARPFVGVRGPSGGFMLGTWRGSVELVREGESLGKTSVEVQITQ